MVLFLPLVWLRKTEKLAFTHIFADIMVIVGLITITIYATQEINTNGIKPLTFITSGFSSAISYAVFAFEGVGVVLPILELTENKENYFTLLSVTLVFICIIFVAFCEYAAFAYGVPEYDANGGYVKGLHPLVLQNLPQDSYVAWTIAVLYSVVVIFTYPLQIGPANFVLESYLFNGWEKSQKRKWCKNLSRSLVVFVTIALTISMYEFIFELIDIAAALTAVPMAFTLPALFHYGAVAESGCSKTLDLIIVVGSIGTSIFCAVNASITFVEKLNETA